MVSLLDPQTGLFESCDGGHTWQPCPLAHMQEQHLVYFEMLGGAPTPCFCPEILLFALQLSIFPLAPAPYINPLKRVGTCMLLLLLVKVSGYLRAFLAASDAAASSKGRHTCSSSLDCKHSHLRATLQAETASQTVSVAHLYVYHPLERPWVDALTM